MKARLIIIAAIILIWTIMAVAIFSVIPQRQARVAPSATPTRTPKPTFTATATATASLTPSITPTPTDTPTATPVATNTPIATDTPLPTDTPTITPVPSDTSTPLPSPTATRRSTPRPTRTRNTATPAPTQPPPPPFTGTIVGGSARCDGFTAVTGFVKHANGNAYAGVAVGVWSDIWEGRVSVSEADGKYDVSLGGVPPGKFKVAVVQLETCGQRDGLPTANACQRRSNVVEVTTTEQCSGAGASQVPMVDFTGP